MFPNRRPARDDSGPDTVRRRATGLLAGFAIDVGVPVAVYYCLRTAGLREPVALGLTAVVSAVRLLTVAVARRRFNGLAAFMLGLYLTGLILSVMTGDARVLLLKDSVPEGLFGLLFMGSCVIRRPLILAVVRRVQIPVGADEPGSAARHRRAMILSAVWGLSFLGFAVARIPVVLVLPLDTAVLAVNLAFGVLFTVLIIGTLVYGRPLWR
ncbi:VC0807 family protein [Nocardia sp. NPDC058658]|uniref:VC0807 family protein n=1 Tax=Nocardia sp. NPDC058658 TaxID=3346580 RepID=UPI0036631F05